MQFLTILKPKRNRSGIRSNTGSRLYFDDFEYELIDDPAAEGISVHFGPDLRPYLPDVFGPLAELLDC